MSGISEALRAAYARLDPDADPAAVDREIAWLLGAGEVVTGRGRIAWARLHVGKRLRALLMAEQGGACVYCRQTLVERGPQNRRPTFEHVVPLGCGGPDHPDNLAVACSPCNQRRGRASEDARKAAARAGI